VIIKLVQLQTFCV